MMRTPTLALMGLALLAPLPGSPASADHGSPWLVAFPHPAAGIPSNGRVVLLSENGPDERVTRPMRHRYRLRASGHLVRLQPSQLVRDRDWDGYGRSHLTLTPTRSLRARARYVLETSEDGGAWEPMRVIATASEAATGSSTVLAAWRVTGADRQAPRVTGVAVQRAHAITAEASRLVVRVDDEGAVGLALVPRRGRAFPRFSYHHEVFGVSEGCVSWPDAVDPPSDFKLYAVDAGGNRTPVEVDPTTLDTVESLCLDPR